MPDQPFKETDVVWRWQTPDEDGPINKCAAETEYGLFIFWQPGGKKWYQTQPANCDLAELLRQLIEVRQERDEAKRSTYCAFCGYEVANDDPDRPGKIAQHVLVCEKHPIHDLMQKLERIEKAWNIWRMTADWGGQEGIAEVLRDIFAQSQPSDGGKEK